MDNSPAGYLGFAATRAQPRASRISRVPEFDMITSYFLIGVSLEVLQLESPGKTELSLIVVTIYIALGS